MGQNRRYPHHADNLADARILERVSHDGPLQSLTPAELELNRYPLTIDPRPSKGLAWVRFGDTPISVVVDVVRWTPRAVGIRFMVGEREMRTWVWSSAVMPLDEVKRG